MPLYGDAVATFVPGEGLPGAVYSLLWPGAVPVTINMANRAQQINAAGGLNVSLWSELTFPVTMPNYTIIPGESGLYAVEASINIQDASLATLVTPGQYVTYTFAILINGTATFPKLMTLSLGATGATSSIFGVVNLNPGDVVYPVLITGTSTVVPPPGAGQPPPEWFGLSYRLEKLLGSTAP